MSEGTGRRPRAGDRIDDLCRACKAIRTHTVMAVGQDASVVRVVCDYCGSHHNYRGGEAAARRTTAEDAPDSRSDGQPGDVQSGVDGPPQSRGDGRAENRTGERTDGWAMPLVSERERRYPKMSNETTGTGNPDLEMLLRRVIREEMGLGPAIPADKWRGGEMVLRPGKPGLQEKSWPIETFFHKVVMLRNRMRVLEQQINGADVPADVKVKLQGYITACYGTLTSFNVLFANEDDRFHGSGGGEP